MGEGLRLSSPVPPASLQLWQACPSPWSWALAYELSHKGRQASLRPAPPPSSPLGHAPTPSWYPLKAAPANARLSICPTPRPASQGGLPRGLRSHPGLRRAGPALEQWGQEQIALTLERKTGLSSGGGPASGHPAGAPAEATVSTWNPTVTMLTGLVSAHVPCQAHPTAAMMPSRP